MSDGPNEPQRIIAETLDGTIVVDAGPGTGKTETIVTRYVNLIARKDVEPKDVLLLTAEKSGDFYLQPINGDCETGSAKELQCIR